MSRDRGQSRGGRGSESGYTLIEMMVTSALLLVVVAIVLPLVSSSLTSFTDSQVRSDTADNTQLALGQIGHDVVSSNFLYLETGATPVVHIQTFGQGALSTCVEYQVQYPTAPQAPIGSLQRRTKAPGSGAAWPAGWTTVMSGIVNSSQPNPAPAVFAVPPASQYQSLVVHLWAQVDTRTGAKAAAPEEYTSTFTGPAIPANAAANATPSSEPC